MIRCKIGIENHTKSIYITFKLGVTEKKRLDFSKIKIGFNTHCSYTHKPFGHILLAIMMYGFLPPISKAIYFPEDPINPFQRLPDSFEA